MKKLRGLKKILKPKKAPKKEACCRGSFIVEETPMEGK